jgi:hypothetical protein
LIGLAQYGPSDGVADSLAEAKAAFRLVHLTTGSTLDRMIRVLIFRDALVQPSLHRTGGVRAFEEERSHCAE